MDRNAAGIVEINVPLDLGCLHNFLTSCNRAEYSPDLPAKDRSAPFCYSGWQQTDIRLSG